MPLALAPSNVFTPSENGARVSETHASYVNFSGAYNPTGMPAWGSPTRQSPAPSGILPTQEPALEDQLASLGARLAALERGVLPAPTESHASADDKEGAPWDGISFDSFAKFAAEASKVRAAGRLPFGSDTKKMAL